MVRGIKEYLGLPCCNENSHFFEGNAKKMIFFANKYINQKIPYRNHQNRAKNGSIQYLLMFLQEYFDQDSILNAKLEILDHKGVTL